VTVTPGTAYVNMAAVSGGHRRVYNDNIVNGFPQPFVIALNDSGAGAGGLNSADWLATFAAADGSNPRIDSVYLIVRDANLDVTTGNKDAKFTVVGGTAAVGATLDNRTGAGAAPNNSLLLADVLIPAGSTTITAAQIRDRRQFGPIAAAPTFGTPVDMVPFSPGTGGTPTAGTLGASETYSAAAVYLPRRIVGATRLRWAYRQTATPTTGNYRLKICDTSGHAIADTGSVAYTGAANTNQVRSETITAQTFEAGVYWLVFGHLLTAGAAPTTLRIANVDLTGTKGIANQMAYLDAGPGTFNTLWFALTAFSDAALSPCPNSYAVPACSLSVG
jgi:hypothetical protein